MCFNVNRLKIISATRFHWSSTRYQVAYFLSYNEQMFHLWGPFTSRSVDFYRIGKGRDNVYSFANTHYYLLEFWSYRKLNLIRNLGFSFSIIIKWLKMALECKRQLKDRVVLNQSRHDIPLHSEFEDSFDHFPAQKNDVFIDFPSLVICGGFWPRYFLPKRGLCYQRWL